jgi:hypothetical protein
MGEKKRQVSDLAALGRIMVIYYDVAVSISHRGIDRVEKAKKKGKQGRKSV